MLAGKDTPRMHTFALMDSLPSSLFCNVLRDWLNLKSVMALKSAYCRKSRGRLQRLLQSNEYFIREKVKISSNSTIWDALQLLGEKVRFVAFEDALSVSESNLIALHCHNLTQVHFEGIGSCTEELLSLVLSLNPKLECVALLTPCLYYSCPPSSFLTFADIQSPNFLSFAQGWGQPDEDRIEVLKMNQCITRLELSLESISPLVLSQIPPLCPHLTHLGLRDTNLTDDILRELAVGCPQIVHLDIGNNELITDAGVLAVVQNLRGLMSINLANVTKLTDVSLCHLHTYCANTLHTLHFSDTAAQEESEEEGEDDQVSQYSAGAINTLLEQCTQLRELYLQFSKSVVFTPAAVRNLTKLMLDGGTVPVCKRNLAIISQYAANLHTLSVGEITTYSRESLLGLVHGCPRLKWFYFCFEDIDMHNIEDYDHNTRQFALAFMDLWMELRPGLGAQRQSTYGNYYKIMD